MQVVFSRKSLVSIAGLTLDATLLPLRREDRRIFAAKARDREAFAELMDAHAVALRRFIARRVRSDDREDIFQDTWLGVWESLPNFDSRSNFRAWIYSICYHKVQDYWRREHYRPPTADLLDQESKLAYLPGEFAAVDLNGALQNFWGACTPDQRELLRLYYSDGLTLKEIGVVLGRNLSTVKYQFYRVHELATQKLPEGADLLSGGSAK